MVDKSPVRRLNHLRARVTTTVTATVMSTEIQAGRQAGWCMDYLHSCTRVGHYVKEVCCLSHLCRALPLVRSVYFGRQIKY